MMSINPRTSGIRIRIGSFQGAIVENNLEANLRKVREVVAEHAGSLDFLCFPETFLSGYAPESINESAIPLDDPHFLALVDFTADYDTVILVGLSERRSDGVYNTQTVLHRGKLLGIQTKIMLTQGYDSRYFQQELDIKVFEAKGVKFGIAICHTSSFVEPALYMRLKGARLLFTPHFNDMPPEVVVPGVGSFSSHAHREMVLNNQAALATLLKMVVVRSNIVVISADHLGWGDSNIWGMDGILAAKGEPFTECVVKADFPLETFTLQNGISHKEVPLQLYRMIEKAAELYLSDETLI
jgi:predicted amidohydrolase